MLRSSEALIERRAPAACIKKNLKREYRYY
jgi:hypothetical protein